MKGRGLDRAKRLLGEGLLTSEGAVHVRQRRLMQPAFHRDRIASYAKVMTEYADRTRQGWTDGQTIDAAQAMNRLALAIVGKTLFDADVESQAKEVGAALTAVMESFLILMLPFVDLLERRDSFNPA
jgi:cytochrome P450